jgi:hypothetical protein
MINTRIEKTDSHIYVNLSINNPSDSQDLVANFDKTFDEVILPDPSEYEGSIIRFSLQGQDIPIINLRNYLQPLSTTNTILTVRLVYNSVNYDVPVIWSSFGPVVSEETKYYVYDYEQICSLINTAFATATTNANSAGAGILLAPQIHFDPQTERMVLYGEQARFDNTTGNVQIWFNQVLYDLFQSLPFITYNTQGFLRLSIARVFNPNNSTTTDNTKLIGAVNTWAMIQNYPTLQQLNTARSIVITSDLPCVNEYLNTVGDTTGSNINTIQLPIISDFILATEVGYDVFTQLNYNPTAEYRIFDLVSSQPLQKVSLNFFWSDQQGVLHPLLISPKRTISCKLMFRRKGYHSGKRPDEIDSTNSALFMPQIGSGIRRYKR